MAEASEFAPTLSKQQTRNFINIHKTSPHRFSEDQLNQIRQNAYYYNVPFYEGDFSILEAVKQAGAGFIEGFTTFNPSEEYPDNEWEAIARNIGHLVGFAPGIVASPMAKVKALQGIAAAIPKRGIPLAIAEDILRPRAQKVAQKVLSNNFLNKNKAFNTAANFLETNLAKDIAKGAFNLGTASAISSWQHGVDAMMDSYFHGAIAGAGFKVIGNKIKLKDKKATTFAKALSGSLFMGIPSTVRGATTPEQIYEYLLGAYFGGKEKTWAQTRAMEVWSQDVIPEVQASKDPYLRSTMDPTRTSVFGKQPEQVQTELLKLAEKQTGLRTGQEPGELGYDVIERISKQHPELAKLLKRVESEAPTEAKLEKTKAEDFDIIPLEQHKKLDNKIKTQHKIVKDLSKKRKEIEKKFGKNSQEEIQAKIEMRKEYLKELRLQLQKEAGKYTYKGKTIDLYENMKKRDLEGKKYEDVRAQIENRISEEVDFINKLNKNLGEKAPTEAKIEGLSYAGVGQGSREVFKAEINGKTHFFYRSSSGTAGNYKARIMPFEGYGKHPVHGTDWIIKRMGKRVGSYEEGLSLYPKEVAEAARKLDKKFPEDKTIAKGEDPANKYPRMQSQVDAMKALGMIGGGKKLQPGDFGVHPRYGKFKQHNVNKELGLSKTGTYLNKQQTIEFLDNIVSKPQVKTKKTTTKKTPAVKERFIITSGKRGLDSMLSDKAGLEGVNVIQLKRGGQRGGTVGKGDEVYLRPAELERQTPRIRAAIDAFNKKAEDIRALGAPVKNIDIRKMRGGISGEAITNLKRDAVKIRISDSTVIVGEVGGSLYSLKGKRYDSKIQAQMAMNLNKDLYVIDPKLGILKWNPTIENPVHKKPGMFELLQGVPDLGNSIAFFTPEVVQQSSIPHLYNIIEKQGFELKKGELSPDIALRDKNLDIALNDVDVSVGLEASLNVGLKQKIGSFEFVIY